MVKVLTPMQRQDQTRRQRERRLAATLAAPVGSRAWVRHLNPTAKAAWTKERRLNYKKTFGYANDLAARHAKGVIPRNVFMWRSWLKDLRERVARCERTWAYHSSPWVLAGYQSKSEWMNLCGSSEAKETKRLDMQTKSASKRAKARRSKRNLVYNQSGFNSSAWHACMQSWGYCCVYCNTTRKACRADGFDLEMDHIHPISSVLFEHSERNIVPACKACNSSKADCDLIEWARSKHIVLPQRLLNKYKSLDRSLAS